MKKWMCVFLCGSAAALAQTGYRPVTIGVKAGVPISDPFSSAAPRAIDFNAGRYTVGGEVECNLPRALGVELDALYRPLDLNASTLDRLSLSRISANAWEFPLLLKIRPGRSEYVQPYIAPGTSFRYVSDISQVTSFFTGRNPQTAPAGRPAALENRFTAGFVIGAGVEFRMPFIRVSPEFRYTRWGWQNFTDPSGLFHSNQNEAAFLVGITF